MPYNKIDDLPEEILNKYKKPAQRRAFMAAFNSTMTDCEGEDCEEKAFRAGHSAAQGVKKAIREHPKMAAVMLRKSRPLVAARNFLARQYPEGDWTADDQFHMTMVSLLDNANHAKLPKTDVSPLDIKITGLSIWETTKDDYAVVFDVEPTDDMTALQKSLYEHYEGHEISGYSQPDNWIPHITLGYMPTMPEQMPSMDFDAFSIEGNRIELMQQKATISKRSLRYAKSSEMDVKIWQDEYGNLQEGFIPYDQIEVSYDALGADDFEGCANCCYFIGNRCMLVKGLISPTAWCDLWKGIDLEPEVEIEMEFGMMTKLLHAIGLRGNKGIIDGSSGFKVIQNGKRFIGWYTNAYEDKEGEGFPAAAIQRDINRMWADNEFPELWFYHVPGSKHGQADWVGMIGRFVVATGTFDDTELAKALVKTYSDETMSHGFVYNPERKVDGWYWDYATFEISPTPIGAEANPLTRFEVGEMTLSEKQIDELRQRLGPLADPLIAAGKSATNAADAKGIAFKADMTEEEDDEKKPSDSEDEMKAQMEALKATIGQQNAAISQLADVVTQLALQPAPAAKPEAPKSKLSPEMEKSILAHYAAVMEAEENQKAFNEMSLGEMVMTTLKNGGGS